MNSTFIYIRDILKNGDVADRYIFYLWISICLVVKLFPLSSQLFIDDVLRQSLTTLFIYKPHFLKPHLKTYFLLSRSEFLSEVLKNGL